MKVYLSDSVKNVVNTRLVAVELTRMGHTVTSSWLDMDYSKSDSDPCDDLEACIKYAEQNLKDISESRLFIFFAEPYKSAGKNVEFGYAISQELIKIIVVGKFNSVFHALADVFVENTDELFAYLKRAYDGR